MMNWSWSELWTEMDPGFLEPIWLYVIPFFIAAFVLVEWGSIRYRRKALEAFVGSTLLKSLVRNVSQEKRLFKRALILAGCVLLLVALARPHLFFEVRERSTISTDVLLAVDCSRSMLTPDVKPSRLERAILAISELADHLPNCRLGLIAFAGDAFLECPLTNDHDAFQNALQELDTDTIPRQGTDISSAIAQGMEALANQPKNHKVMILVTDGEDLEGMGISSAEAAAKQGLKIYCVGVGTTGGDRIPIPDGNGGTTYLQDSNGTEVRSHLDEATLKKIAEVSGGAYAPLGQQGEGLTEIYNRYFANLPSQTSETKQDKIPYEQFVWPLSLAILLLAVETLITEKGKDPELAKRKAIQATQRPLPPQRRRPKSPAMAALILLLGALALTPVWANSGQAEVNYKSEKYKEAMNGYEDAAKDNKDTLLEEQLDFNAGDAAYRAGNYTEAQDAFNKALHTKNLPLQEKTYYNLGNTNFKKGLDLLKDSDRNRTISLWEDALKSYQSALDLNAKNKPAKENYDTVKKLLEELKKQPTPPPQSGGKGKSDDKGSKGDKGDKGKGDAKGDSQDDPDKGQNGDQSQAGGNTKNNQDPGSQQSKPQQNPGDKPDDQAGQDPQNQPKPDQQQPGGGGDQTAHDDKQASDMGSSNARAEDTKDPGAKSREEAIYLLDSLKDEEHHISSRQMADGTTPPPTASGKEW